MVWWRRSCLWNQFKERCKHTSWRWWRWNLWRSWRQGSRLCYERPRSINLRRIRQSIRLYHPAKPHWYGTRNMGDSTCTSCWTFLQWNSTKRWNRNHLRYSNRVVEHDKLHCLCKQQPNRCTIHLWIGYSCWYRWRRIARRRFCNRSWGRSRRW